MSILTSDHNVYFEGTGLFEETIDLNGPYRPPQVTEVTVDLALATNSGYYTYYLLEAPDGQQQVVCTSCSGGNSTHTVTFSPTHIEGDWQLYGRKGSTILSGFALNSWALTFNGTAHHESVLYPRFYPSVSYTLADTITIRPMSYSIGSNNLYPVATGMNTTGKTAVISATDQAFDAPLAIRNMPRYAPYVITDNGNVLKLGTADDQGRIEIPHGGLGANIAGPIEFEYWPNSLTYAGNHHAAGKGILFDTYHDRVISFPWDPADPLLYVAKAYVRMSIPVDDMSLGGIRLYNDAGQYVSYPYLTGTYNAGDEVYVPIFPATTEIHLQINSDWVQSYVKDVQQNTRALVFGGTGSIEGVELTETATIFATKPGEVVALISATASGSSTMYFRADYSGGSRAYNPVTLAQQQNVDYFGAGGAASACANWINYAGSPNIQRLHATVSEIFNNATSGGVVSVSAYHNGVLVDTVSSIVVDTDSRSYTRPSCRLLDPSDLRPDAQIIPRGGPNPWAFSLSQTVEFDGEAFNNNIRITNVEAGDQRPDPLLFFKPARPTFQARFHQVVCSASHSSL